MNPTRLSIGAAAALAAAGAAQSATAATTAHAARSYTVAALNTNLGKILTTGSGYTLYLFTADHRNSDVCVKVADCTGTWPPYTVKGRPTAGPGVKASLLGTISLGHGRSQVTYAGHPLYGYATAEGPDETGYLGTPEFGGSWDAVTVAGHAKG